MRKFLAIVLSAAIIMNLGTSQVSASKYENDLNNSGYSDNCSWIIPVTIGVGVTLVIGIAAYKFCMRKYISQTKIQIVGRRFESEDILTYSPKAGVEYIENLISSKLPRFGKVDEIQASQLSTVQSFCSTAKMIVEYQIENGAANYTELYDELFSKENIIMQIQKNESISVEYLRDLLISVKDLLAKSSNI